MQFLKSYLTDYINTYVFEYFDNISKEQVTTQLSKGQIQLNNMQFKPNIFKKFNLPLIIRESIINNISITLGKQYSIKIDTLHIVIEILNLYGNFIMESAIKLQILDKFKNTLVEDLLKAMAAQDKQQQDPKKKFAFNLIQNMEVELTNLNITIIDKYCTQNSFGIKLEHLTCKSSSNPNQSKLRNIEIKNLQLFWQDPVTQLNAYATLEDVAELNSDILSFQLGIVFDRLQFNCSKNQCNSIYRFSDYISQFTKRQNQQVEQSQNKEDDEKTKAEIKNILKSISLTESSMESQAYEQLCQLAQTQSINDLKQIQFEILKYDKGEEIFQLRKKKLGWFGGMVKNDKKMEEKIINILDVLEQDPNMQQQYLKSLQLKFELVINQCQIGLSSIYRGQLNQLIINFKNISMSMIKTNQLQLDFTVKQAEALLQYQDKINYLISKNTNFEDRYILELHLINEEKKESLFIQTCPFQILFNQEAFEKYYDLFYFFVVSENQLPKLTRKAKEQIQDIVSDKKEKDINFKFEKVYILSTNSKETFLFSPGSLEFNYKTQNQSLYKIKISDTTFGFSEKISSCINFINQEYCFNSIIISRDFFKITKCDIDLIIYFQDNQIKSILELGDLTFQINPIIYKYLYQFYGTHFQQPLKELKNQLRSNEENQLKFCFFYNPHNQNKIKCRFTFQKNFLNLYEVEKDEKIMKIDLENISYQKLTINQDQVLKLITNNQNIQLDFQTDEDRELIVNQCQISRNDNYFVKSILQQNQTDSVNFQKNQQLNQESLSSFEMKLNSIYIVVFENNNQPCLNVQIANLNYLSVGSQLQQNTTLKFNHFIITRDVKCQNHYFQDKKFLEIENDQNYSAIVEYSKQLNEESTVKFSLPYCLLSYRAKIIGQILEFYPIEMKQDWNLTKFIINSYLTQYPDLQIICNKMIVEINLKQILFKQSELKQIKWSQNFISIMFLQDSPDEDCLQFTSVPQGILKVQNQKEMIIQIMLQDAQAIFTQQQTLQSSIYKRKSTKKVLLSSCNIFFDWQLVFQTKVINHQMNLRINQLKVTLGTQDICYIIKEMKKLSNQIKDFYDSHDIASYLIQYREKTYSLTVGVETIIQAVFIDDFLNSSLPMFGIIQKQPLLKLQLNQNDMYYYTRNLFELYNYHSTKFVWEPIIEPIYLELILQISNLKPKINLDFNIQDICNINISMEILSNILKFKNLIKSSQLNEQKQGNRQINQNYSQIITYETYEIFNSSGLLIVAQGEDRQTFELTNLQKKLTKCNGVFQFDIYGINTTIKIQNWSLKQQKKKVIQEKGLTLIIETIVDEFMNSSRTIISSNILLINQTPFPLQIKISHQEILNLDKSIRHQQFQKFQKYQNIYQIPSHYQKGQFCLFENNQSSENFNYSNIVQKLKKDNFEILSLNKKFFRIKCVHDPLMKERSIISIVPIVEFINQTPFKIRIDKHCPQAKQFTNFIIMQNEIVPDCEINPSIEYLFSFSIDRYYQSIQYSFDDLMKERSVLLEDEKWQLNYDKKNLALQLLIRPKIDNYGRHQIIIQFDKPYLINNTKLDLIFYQGIEKNLEILGGQKQNTSQQLITLKKIQDKHILIFEERNTNLKSQPLMLTQIINSETLYIQKKENNQLYYLPIQIEKNVIQMGDQTIPYFELCYKYMVFNRLNQIVQLCYEDKKIILEPFIKLPLQIWNQNLLNDADLPYECSLKINFENYVLQTARFNIMAQQQFIMLLRSIDLCIRLFIKVSILELKGQFIFFIDEIENQQDFPYIIINESKSLQIQLKSDNETLTYGDRFPLANSYQTDREFTYLVNLKDQKMKWENSIQFQLMLDQIGLNGTIEINRQKYDYTVIQIAQQKQFIFKDFQQLSQSQIQIEQEKIQYILELKMQIFGCTISYFENLKYQYKELAICFLENIIMNYQSNEQNYKQINFKLQKIQIDSQSKSLSEEKTILFSEVQQSQNSIEFEFRLDGSAQNCICVDLVKINFGNFQFCMDQRLKDKQEQIQAQFYDLIGQQSIQNSRNQQLTELEIPTNLNKKINSIQIKQAKIFVKKLILCPIKMKISYLQDIYQLERQHFVQENFISSPSNLFHKIMKKYIFGDSKFLFNMIGQFLINKLNINQTKLTNWNEIRIKRVLYEQMKFYKVFNKQQAKNYQILKQAQKCDRNREYSNKKFIIISIHEVLQKGQTKILYICDQQIFFIHQNLIQNYMEYETIQLVYSQPDILHLHIVSEKEEITLLLEDQQDLQIATQNLNRFQN
ncbi:unnamed protein product [Paramecium sonneborni]|uniref:Chorein N-terminal domain-containing protein n=1 Tax=Paramecium sonneborni TaxID=65129 RepID=A0A8S1RKN9_9CILI|nr:unnamed protein product [Paramecium sonneborni]